MVTIVVPGRPVGKSRPRFTRTGHVYTDAKTRANENAIKKIFQQKYPNFAPLAGPLEMDVAAYFQIPKSVSKKRAQDMRCQRESPIYRPDIDNINKLVQDALNGLAYYDDAQIVSQMACKRYANTAYTEIKIRRLGEEP